MMQKSHKCASALGIPSRQRRRSSQLRRSKNLPRRKAFSWILKDTEDLDQHCWNFGLRGSILILFKVIEGLNEHLSMWVLSSAFTIFKIKVKIIYLWLYFKRNYMLTYIIFMEYNYKTKLYWREWYCFTFCILMYGLIQDR